MNLTKIPLFEELSNSQNILIAGAGGGYDIYSGVPLFLALKKEGKNVHLANLSFTVFNETIAHKVCEKCWRIDSNDMTTKPENGYFAEKYLSIWLKSYLHEEMPVYAFARTGVQKLQKAYKYLVELLDIDTILLVDGGTDSLMFGEEPSLGTPLEDSSSIASVYKTKVAQKYLVCLGFGIDAFHGISHYHFLENVAKLSKEGGYLGTFSLLAEMEEGEALVDLVKYANQKMRPSIVANSVVSAIEGHFANHHATKRTQKSGSELFINPLMNMYWAFKLDNVAQNIQYLPNLYETKNFVQVMRVIDTYKLSITPQKRQNIPL